MKTLKYVDNRPGIPNREVEAVRITSDNVEDVLEHFNRFEFPNNRIDRLQHGMWVMRYIDGKWVHLLSDTAFSRRYTLWSDLPEDSTDTTEDEDEALAALRRKLYGEKSPEKKSREQAQVFIRTHRSLSKASMRVLAAHHSTRGMKHVSWLPEVLKAIDAWNEVQVLQLAVQIHRAVRDTSDVANVRDSKNAAKYIIDNYDIRKKE